MPTSQNILKIARLAAIAALMIAMVTALGNCLGGVLASAHPPVESPVVPDAVNYAGLCRWDCGDDVPRVAVSWNETDAILCPITNLDTASGIWLPDSSLRPSPIGSSSAGIIDCLNYGGPDEPYAPWNPTNDCCRAHDRDWDGDVDLADFAVHQTERRPNP